MFAIDDWIDHFQQAKPYSKFVTGKLVRGSK
jgi:hypothetical protein